VPNLVKVKNSNCTSKSLNCEMMLTLQYFEHYKRLEL